jgi:ketosteroid isomerase-like protein
LGIWGHSSGSGSPFSFPHFWLSVMQDGGVVEAEHICDHDGLHSVLLYSHFAEFSFYPDVFL